MSLSKKVFMAILTIAVILVVLLFINFIPSFSLKTKDMKELQGDYFTLYYENEEESAFDIVRYAYDKIPVIVARLGMEGINDVCVYLYDDQKTMQRQKYGFIAPLLHLDWYIGDNIGTNVILTSPKNPGTYHSGASVKEASIHELIHAYISYMNPDIDLWLTEGMALFLSNGQEVNKETLLSIPLPSYADTKTKNPIRFTLSHAYNYAHTYIEYIKTAYGWDSVLKLIQTQNYKKVFNKSRKAIYNEWIDFINYYYD